MTLQSHSVTGGWSIALCLVDHPVAESPLLRSPCVHERTQITLEFAYNGAAIDIDGDVSLTHSEVLETTR